MNIAITCETEGAEIRYTLNGSDPTESDTLYQNSFEINSSTLIKAKAFKEGMRSSGISQQNLIPITVPMVLPDNSVLFYDRGNQYGSYSIGLDGYPKRNDGLIDDETAESQNWRYLIIANDGPRKGTYNQWITNTNLDNKGTAIGTGLPNTAIMIEGHENDNLDMDDPITWPINAYTSLCWIKRRETGLNWFFPSINEIKEIYPLKDFINENTENSLSSNYHTSSVIKYEYSWVFDFDSGTAREHMVDGLMGGFLYIRRI